MTVTNTDADSAQRRAEMQKLNKQPSSCQNRTFAESKLHNFIINKQQFNSFRQYSTIPDAIHTNSALQTNFLMLQQKSQMLFLVPTQKPSVHYFAMPKRKKERKTELWNWLITYIYVKNNTALKNTVQQATSDSTGTFYSFHIFYTRMNGYYFILMKISKVLYIGYVSDKHSDHASFCRILHHLVELVTLATQELT